AEWDAAALQPAHLAATLHGRVEQALAWLRAHPQFAAAAPGMTAVPLTGDTAIEVALTLPGASAAAPPARTPNRIAARRAGGQLQGVAGLPPLTGLRGTLTFSAGHLMPSNLTGQWLEGPVSLAIGERRESGATALAISGHGSVQAAAALRAAGARDDAA